MDLGKQSINGFLDDISSNKPTPGGGAIAGVLSALSTALGNMVISFSEGKKSLAEFESLHTDCKQLLLTAKAESSHLGEADADAYEKVNALWKLPKDDSVRIAQWDTALHDAIQVPLRTMELSKHILMALQSLTGKTNKMLESDLAIAAILAEASARSAFWNIGINTDQLTDEDEKNSFDEEASALLSACKQLTHSIESVCRV